MKNRTPPTQPFPRLTREQLLQLLAAEERAKQDPDTDRPDCFICHSTVTGWTADPIHGVEDERVVTVQPCGHGMTYSVEVGEMLAARVRAQAATEATEPADTCRPVVVDGETIRVRGTGELSSEGQEALAALARVAKAQFVAEAPEMVGELQNRLRLAHQARRAKEHQLDGIRRALCDAGFMQEDDPYSHADLADVVRQAGELVGPLLAEVKAARKFAAEMREFCSPHGVSVGYADQLEAAMNRAKEGAA